jgi:hypothetical protein
LDEGKNNDDEDDMSADCDKVNDDDATAAAVEDT